MGSARIVGNTMATVLSMAVPAVLGLWSLKPLVSLLGVESFTLLSFFWVYTSHAGFFDLGISRSLGIELPKLSFPDQSVWLLQCIRKGLDYSVYGTLLVGVVLLLLSRYHTEWAVLGEWDVLVILLSWVPLSVLQMIVRGALEAAEQFIGAAFFRAFNQSVLFLVPWVMAHCGYQDLVQMVLVMSVLRLTALLIAWGWLMHTFGIPANENRTPTKELRVHQNNGWITLSNVSGIVNGSLDRFLLLSVMGAQVMGTYVFAQDFGVRLLVLSSSFALVLLPFFSKNANKSYNHRWVHWGLGLTLLLHLGFGLLLYFGQTWLIQRFDDGAFAASALGYFWIFLLGITANGMGHVLLSALHSHREIKNPALCHGISALVYIPVLYWVVVSYGLLGAALLWSFRSVVDTVVLYWLWRK